MNRDSVRSDIGRSWEATKALALNELFTNPVPLNPSDEFITATLDASSTYEDVYLCGLSNSDYNILLVDYSYLQYGFSKDEHVRYAYYPNPFIGASSEAVAELSELREYVEDELLTVEEYLAKISELRQPHHPPLMRYENAPDQYQESTHPCSHWHFGFHGENRWAVQRMLTPLAFTLIILRHFYASQWHAIDDLRLFGKTDRPDTFLREAKEQSHVLGDDHFSPNEQRLFYWA